MGYVALDDSEYDPLFDTKAEDIPGGFIIQREIRKAVRGENFFLNDEETGEPVRVPGVTPECFWYYYKLWENFHYFGLPQGKGWQAEREWLLEILKAFEKASESVKYFVQDKMSKKGNVT